MLKDKLHIEHNSNPSPFSLRSTPLESENSIFFRDGNAAGDSGLFNVLAVMNSESV